MCRTALFLFLPFLVLPAQGAATDQLAYVEPHLVKQTAPVYPAIAKAVHVSGQVKLQAEIGSDGHVQGTKVISGPEMLRGSAQDCAKQWVYEPALKDGKPVAASTVIAVNFGLPVPSNPDDEKIAAQFFLWTARALTP